MIGKLKDMFNGKTEKIDYGKYNILIVEDSQVDQRLIQDILTKRGFNVAYASNGQEGLVKAKEIKPDLIILDCEMPVMGGIEMCKTLKQTLDLTEIPVIFLTSLDTPKNIIDCFELDAENYLSKPVSPKILLSEIHNVLKLTTS